MSFYLDLEIALDFEQFLFGFTWPHGCGLNVFIGPLRIGPRVKYLEPAV